MSVSSSSTLIGEAVYGSSWTIGILEGAGCSGSESIPSVEPNCPHSDLLLRVDASESDDSQKENIRRNANFRGTPVDTTRANQDGKPVEQVFKRVVEQCQGLKCGGH